MMPWVGSRLKLNPETIISIQTNLDRQELLEPQKQPQKAHPEDQPKSEKASNFHRQLTPPGAAGQKVRVPLKSPNHTSPSRRGLKQKRQIKNHLDHYEFRIFHRTNLRRNHRKNRRNIHRELNSWKCRHEEWHHHRQRNKVTRVPKMKVRSRTRRNQGQTSRLRDSLSSRRQKSPS